MMKGWRRYEELRPDELEQIVREHPIAYWPLGLLEHHGWHLPIGFDGIKATRICERCATQTGGVVLPVMWWGGSGGHGNFKWTHYQDEQAAGEMAYRTVERLYAFGFRTVVLLCGHYPWEGILKQTRLDQLAEELSDFRLIYGTEVSIADSGVPPGDHAARQETTYGLHLLPEFVRMDALTFGRGEEVWAGGKVPDEEFFGGLAVDPDSPHFSQLGEDAALATAEAGERQVEAIVESLVQLVAAPRQNAN